MGSLSISTHRGFVHWQGLLLVVSLFNFWSHPTTAQVAVESIDALEGMDVVLNIHQRPLNAEYFLWFRGTTVDSYTNIAYLVIRPGSRVRGAVRRELRVQDDGSLLLKNVTMNHSGSYTIMVLLQGCQKMIACGYLTVYRPVSVPILRASKTTVTENKDAVVFTCDTNSENIDWFFKDARLPLTERRKMSLDRRNLTIDPVLRWDAGVYHCKASNPRSSGTSAPLKLNVEVE
ncbi:carcinoembryonic antigen-related cell adhesion molecule 21-like [Phyllostomus hastatus]|uniref:carcinoembryonic antigen-related cell adhesion molecule 21-like n=1 Tax=Phyllostomus hastatus TaxID=9423 RepID=UPI001E682A0C|nr:carcinoembryonic antigen-related cell adhesion molecule 21-like [Phyllostomus hastatus]